MRKVMAVWFIILLVTASSAYAQINAKTYSLSPFFGGYTFDGGEGLKTRPVSGLRLGYDITRHWGVEGVFTYMRAKYTSSTVLEAYPEVYGYRLEGLYHFMPQSRLVPYLAVGFGGRSIHFKDLPLDRNHADIDYGVGLKYFLYNDLAIRADVRHVFLLNDNLHNLEYTLGISYYFGGPKPAKAAPPPKAEAPVPPPPPKEKPLLPAPVNLSAKAASQSQINLAWNAVPGTRIYKIYRDGSYLDPTQDATLPDKGLKASTRYCYAVTALDDTGRESARSNEACATTPAPPPPAPPPPLAAPINLTATPASESQINLGWSTVPGASGYKIYRDGSYVTYSQTAATPDRGLKAGTRYCYRVTARDDKGRESVQSNEACAMTPAPPVVMEQKREASAAVAAVAKEMFEKGRARINVEFDTNKADIKPKYKDEIGKFADVMKHYPELRVVIEGHTDSVGGKAYNQKLSERRAESVKNYMVKTFGIDTSRLSSKGYGMTKPIDNNKTAKGRQKNRRVEAVVDYMKKK